MTSGGARARSGPAPDPNALKHSKPGAEKWTTLPVEGRIGVTPVWPLINPTARETELWTALWRKPQAVMWERNQQELEVALYVRNLAVVEKPDSPINAGTLLRQQGDALGLSIPGMHVNRWVIGQSPAAERRTAAAAAEPARPSSKTRFTVVRNSEASAA